MRWKAEQIRRNLATNRVWLERGVLAIYAYQTDDEQAAHSTRRDNGVGFNAADAPYLSYVATWLRQGRHLSGSHLQKTRERMLKYAGQLARIANERGESTS